MQNSAEFSGRSDADRLIRKLTVEAVEAKKEFAYEKAKDIYLMLKAAVEQSYGAGRELLEIYLELIDVYISLEEYDEAGLAIDEASRIVSDLPDRLQLLKRRTKYLFSVPKFDEARELALESLELAGYPDGDYSPHAAAVAHFLGDIAKADLYRDRLDSAMFFAKKAEEEAEKAEDLAERSRALNILAYCIRWKDNDVRGAIDIWTEAAEMAKKSGNPEVEGNIYHGIGNAYWQLRDGENSRKYYGKALMIFENIGLMEGIAMELKGIGDTYLTEEKYEIAVDYFMRAVNLYTMLKDEKNRAAVSMHLGLCHMNRGDFKLAQEEFFKAKSLAALYEKGSDSVETAVLMNLAELYDRMKMYDMEEKMAFEVLEEIEKGMQIRERDVDIATIKLYRARVEMARGNKERARALLNEAIRGLKEDKYYLYLLAEAYARLHALTGKEENLLAAIKYLRDSGSETTLERLKKEGFIPEDTKISD